MFELMDDTSDKAIIQVMGLGEKGQSLSIGNTKKINQFTSQMDAVLQLPNISMNDNSNPDSIHPNELAFWFVSGIAELIALPGLICVDFAFVYEVLLKAGTSFVGSGHDKGNKRAKNATEKAIFSPQFEYFDFSKAKGIIVNISAGMDLRVNEVDEVEDCIKPLLGAETKVCLGSVIKLSMNNEIQVTIIAT